MNGRLGGHVMNGRNGLKRSKPCSSRVMNTSAPNQMAIPNPLRFIEKTLSITHNSHVTTCGRVRTYARNMHMCTV
jgi:hypothetical protein